MGVAKSGFATSNDYHFNAFSLLWLDAEVNTVEENIAAQRELRQITGECRTFDDLYSCQKYISYCSRYDRLVLIVSGRLAKKIVPTIHSSPQVSSIYVYCRDKEAYDKWARCYMKVFHYFFDCSLSLLNRVSI